MTYQGEYGKTFARFWDGPTGRAIQEKGKDALILSLYLQSCRHSNMIGLYELPFVHIERELSVLKARIPILRAFHDLHVLHYATYDMGTEHVWVREMARIRVGLDRHEPIHRGDKKHRAILKLYQSAKPNPFLGPFYERYVEQLVLDSGRIGPPLIPVSKTITEKNTTQLSAGCGKVGLICGKGEAIQTGFTPLRRGKSPPRTPPLTTTTFPEAVPTAITGKAAAAPRMPDAGDQPQKNVEVITTLILQEIFPLLGVDAAYADVCEATKSRCARLKIGYGRDVVHKAYESALVRMKLKRAAGGQG